MNQAIGVIGLAVMGENLALNIERNGFPIAVYNRTPEKTDQFLRDRARGKQVVGARSIPEFVNALARPRRMLTMVKAGAAVDAVIEELKPHLAPGDIVVDGGNSHYVDTDRRLAALTPTGLKFFGMGVSGGEEGALWGPSLMPGGDEATYRHLEDDPDQDRRQGRLRPVRHLRRREERRPLRQDGAQRDRVRRHAAHRRGLRPHAPRPRPVDRGDRRHLRRVERGRAQVLPHRDHREDRRRARRSGRQEAAHRSDRRQRRAEGHRQMDDAGRARPRRPDPDDHRGGRRAHRVGDAADAARGCQGLPRIAGAGARVATHRPRSDPLRALRREDLLVRAGLPPPGRAPPRRSATACSSTRWRASGRAAASSARSSSTASAPRSSAIRSSRTSSSTRSSPATSGRASTTGAPRSRSASRSGSPLPATAASLAYFDGLRRARLPANLIQAQRDFFGAHTYERLDRPGTFHTDWARAAAPAETSTAAAKPARAAAARAPRRR